MSRRRPRNNFVDVDVRAVPVFIYGLADPGTWRLRYIGRSQSPLARLAAHRSSCQSFRVFTWLKGLERSGKKPQLVILRLVRPGEDAATAELQEIRNAEADGHPLLNYFGLRSPPKKLDSTEPSDIVREAAEFGDSYSRMRVECWGQT